MKKIIYILLIAFVAGAVFSCKNMDDIYKEFIVPNGLKYPQKPDSLKVYGGYNRVRLTWLKAKDPSVVRAEIYWNNYQDTLKVDIDNDQDTIVVDVDNLKEDTYTFYVKTFDNKGNASIPSEVTGTSYGDNYLMGATDRTIASALRDDNKTGIITWNTKSTDLVYSEVRYTTSTGKSEILRVLPEETTVICPDIKPGEFFEYRSVFLPDKGIDSVARDWQTFEKPFMYKYPRGTWTAVSRNGNHSWGGGGQPYRLFDGNVNHPYGWHSPGTPLPQCVSVDMKQSQMVDYITIYPPSADLGCYLKDIEIYLTDTFINPDDPNLTTILSSMTPVAKMQYSGSGGGSFNIFLPTPLAGRYMTLLFPTNSITWGPYVSVMELEVYGY